MYACPSTLVTFPHSHKKIQKLKLKSLICVTHWIMTKLSAPCPSHRNKLFPSCTPSRNHPLSSVKGAGHWKFDHDPASNRELISSSLSRLLRVLLNDFLPQSLLFFWGDWDWDRDCRGSLSCPSLACASAIMDSTAKAAPLLFTVSAWCEINFVCMGR